MPLPLSRRGFLAAIPAFAAPAVRREVFLASPKKGTAVMAYAFYTRKRGGDMISIEDRWTRSDTVDVAFLRRSRGHEARQREDGLLRRLHLRPVLHAHHAHHGQALGDAERRVQSLVEMAHAGNAALRPGKAVGTHLGPRRRRAPRDLLLAPIAAEHPDHELRPIDVGHVSRAAHVSMMREMLTRS